MTYRNVYVQLARLGDCLNILPLLWADAQQGHRSAIMVQEKYVPHLENSYYDTLIWSGEPHDLQGAVEGAQRFGNAICTQVLGPAAEVLKWTYQPAGLEHAVCTSYQKDAWRVAGRLAEWDQCLPLVFDRRDVKRENATPLKGRKKLILVAADGITSPFKFKPLLMQLLELTGCKIIDLSTVKAERFYDLLGLYELAHCLVAIDSAPLHLSRAVPKLPVVALANDKPILWNGSSWRPQFIWYCRYSDFPTRAHEIVPAIRDITPLTENPHIIHVWNAYEGGRCKTPDSRFAQWVPTPVEIGACGRDSAQAPLSDPRRFPYLRDSLRMGLQRAKDNDWVCLTKPGITVEKHATESLVSRDASFAYRITVNGNGKSYAPVGDLFCAKKAWWQSVISEIPDFVFGADHYWPNALAALFRQKGGADLTGCCYRE